MKIGSFIATATTRIALAMLCAQHINGFTCIQSPTCTSIRIINNKMKNSKLFNSAQDETQSLREKAAQLRQEVSEFENSKQEQKQEQDKARVTSSLLVWDDASSLDDTTTEKFGIGLVE